MVKKNICVFCGASSGSSPDFITLAEKIGKMIEIILIDKIKEISLILFTKIKITH